MEKNIEHREVILALEANLINKIKEDIKNKENIEDISIKPIRKIDEFYRFFRNVLIENNPYDSNTELYCNKIDETCYDNINKIPFKNLQENYYNTFEVILLKLYEEFLGINREIESITIEELENKYIEKLYSYEIENQIRII